MTNKYIYFVNEFANIPHYNVCRIFVLGHPLLLYSSGQADSRNPKTVIEFTLLLFTVLYCAVPSQTGQAQWFMKEDTSKIEIKVTMIGGSGCLYSRYPI